MVSSAESDKRKESKFDVLEIILLFGNVLLGLTQHKMIRIQSAHFRIAFWIYKINKQT